MKRLRLCLLAALLIAAAVFLWIQHQSQEKLRAEINSLTDENNQLKAGTENLSNLLAQANSSQGAGKEQLSELLKLRSEVSMLRGQTGQLANLRAENARLKAAPALVAASAPVDTDEIRQAALMKMSNAKQGVLAFIMFASDNQNVYPTNFSQAGNYANAGFLSGLETNFDMLYQGSAGGITNPAGTIVLREKQAWQNADGRWSKVYGFADGHSEVHTSPNGNFDDWENQRIQTPAGQ